MPVAAQPADEAAVCLTVSTVAWIARPPVWQDAQALVVSLSAQLPVIVEVDAALLWQFRHALAFVVLAEVASECSASRPPRPLQRRGRRHTQWTQRWQMPEQRCSAHAWPRRRRGRGWYRVGRVTPAGLAAGLKRRHGSLQGCVMAARNRAAARRVLVQGVDIVGGVAVRAARAAGRGRGRGRRPVPWCCAEAPNS